MESPVFVDVLETIGRRVFAPAGTVLFRRGHAASAAYLVRAGRVALVWNLSAKMHPLDIRGPGAVVGLPTVFNGTCCVTARVVEDADLVFVPVDVLLQVLDSDPRLLRQAREALAREVLLTRAFIVAHAENSKFLRIARRILS